MNVELYHVNQQDATLVMGRPGKQELRWKAIGCVTLNQVKRVIGYESLFSNYSIIYMQINFFWILTYHKVYLLIIKIDTSKFI